MLDEYSNYLEQWKNQETEPPPITDLLGIELVNYAEAGQAEVSMEVKPEHYNAIGTLHGGVFCDLVDVAMGTALVTQLNENEAFSTLEMKMNYFESVESGIIRAEAEVVRRGRSTAYLEGTVTDPNDNTLAKGSSTYMILGNESS